MPRILKRGWLEAYEEYTQQSESPEAYHLWTALSLVSAAVRRHVWLSQGHYTIYPNLYVVLVSPPGTCKKSVAMNIGLRLLRKVNGVFIESNKMSTQSLINTLSGGQIDITKKKKKKAKSPDEQLVDDFLKEAAGDTASAPKGAPKQQQKASPPNPGQPSYLVQTECTTMLASTEFSVMLGVDANQNGMLSLLTDLFDSPDTWQYKTIKRGTETLCNVFLSILGATTPEWLGTSIPQDAIGGGFTSRILFVAQSQRRKDVPRPKLTARELELRELLTKDLQHIAGLKGEITLTDEAEAWYDDWYRTRDRHYLDERFWGYLERKPDHLLKVAILISVAESDALIVTDKHLVTALALLDALEDRMPDAFKGVGGANARDIERIVDQLINHGSQMSFNQIAHLNYRHINSKELEIIMQTMTDAGIVTFALVGKLRMYTLNTTNRKKRGVP